MIRFNRQEQVSLPSVRLEGSRAVLRPPTAEDWQDWATLRHESRAFLAPWEPSWSPDALSEATYSRRLQRLNTEWRNEEGYNFHVFDRARGHIVGGIGLTYVRRGISQAGVIGYWVGERYARQGYTGEATSLLLDFAFQKIGLHRVEASCIPRNTASIGLLEKLGFRREGYAIKYLKIAGVWEDHLLYAMLAEERG